MTSFHDPQRPRLANGNPTWLTAPVALPHLHLTPVATGQDLWLVEIILEGSWIEVELPLPGVMHLLHLWRADPELALNEYWGREPPERALAAPAEVAERRTVSETEVNAEDLGL